MNTIAVTVAKKVLYIEDNPVNTLIMQAMLARLGGGRVIEVLVAALPLDGLQIAIEEQPDLILLDIELPGIDGFEVLQRLHRNDTCRRIPVIAVTAHTRPEEVAHVLAAGFDQCLGKPLDMHELHAAVERVFARPG